MPIPATLIPVILQLVATYGPGIITGIETLLQKNNPTTTDITNIFAGLQPYSAFGIAPPVAGAATIALKPA